MTTTRLFRGTRRPISAHPRSVVSLAALFVVAIAAGVFWRTAYPTITWWDSSQMSMAATTLSITSSPPNSLLLTLVGWPVSHLPLGMSPAHNLNLLAGLFAALTAGLVLATAARLLRAPEPHVAVAAALGALAFAFNATMWSYATRFTPYMLTALFTALMLWTLVRWSEDADAPRAWRHLAIFTLLLGLDFSVHRTNALLVPGALAWILCRHPRTFAQAKAWAGAWGGLFAGLALHLLVIPISASRDAPLNWPDPSNVARFWDYVMLKSRGAGLLLAPFPRKSPVWSVQAADLAHVLRTDFANVSSSVGWLAVLPALAAVVGLAHLWRRDRRIAAGFTALLLLQAAMTVLFFNIPANYFRTFDRHYLPVAVTIGVLCAIGLGAIAASAVRIARARMRPRLASAGVLALAAVVPLEQLVANWRAQDASRQYFARDYAENVLRSLPNDAIYFTVGDNDTFPVLYLQTAEHLRPDVTVVNLSVASSVEFGDRIARRHPEFPMSTSHEQRAALPASELMHATLADIYRTNRGRRPLTFAISGTRSAMDSLSRYGRLDGLYWRVVSGEHPPPDTSALITGLTRNVYRGYGDPSVRIDDVSRTMGFLYHEAFRALQDALVNSGDLAHCRELTSTFLVSVPPHRIDFPDAQATEERERCGGVD